MQDIRRISGLSLTSLYITLVLGVVIGAGWAAALVFVTRIELFPRAPIAAALVFLCAPLLATLFVKWRYPGAPWLMLRCISSTPYLLPRINSERLVLIRFPSRLPPEEWHTRTLPVE